MYRLYSIVNGKNLALLKGLSVPLRMMYDEELRNDKALQVMFTISKPKIQFCTNPTPSKKFGR